MNPGDIQLLRETKSNKQFDCEICFYMCRSNIKRTQMMPDFPPEFKSVHTLVKLFLNVVLIRLVSAHSIKALRGETCELGATLH